MVGKREFGETCKPDAYYQKGYSKTGRYTEDLVFHQGLSFGKPEDGAWKPLPSKEAQNRESSTVMKAGISASFLEGLECLINQYSQENASNTPDFILAQYLEACLQAFNTATQQRETWYGRDASPTLSHPHEISFGKGIEYKGNYVNATIKHLVEDLPVKCVNDEQLREAKRDCNYIEYRKYPTEVKRFYNEMGHNGKVRYVLDKKIYVQLSQDVQEFANNINDNLSLTIHTEINKLLLYMRRRGFAPFATPVRIMQEEGVYGLITGVHCYGGYIGKRLVEMVEVIEGYDELNEYQKIAAKIDPEFGQLDASAHRHRSGGGQRGDFGALPQAGDRSVSSDRSER
jgi:hypothetical protein